MADGAGSLTLREAVADALQEHLSDMVGAERNRSWLSGSLLTRTKPLEYEIAIPGARGKPRSILVKISERR